MKIVALPIPPEYTVAVARISRPQRLLETLLANLDGMVYRCRDDETWTMEFVSDGCLELTGYQPEDVLFNRKVSYEDMTHSADYADVRRSIRAGLALKYRFELEYRIICGHILNLWVLAEGVDDQEQYKFLLENGCDDVQGYLLSKSMPVDDFTRRLGHEVQNVY